MAYFSNGSEGMCLDEECSECVFGQEHCPIAWVQLNWNYEAVNNKVAGEILDYLIKEDGTCAMKKSFNDKLQYRELNESNVAISILHNDIDLGKLIDEIGVQKVKDVVFNKLFGSEK